jgi:hypothetical protein
MRRLGFWGGAARAAQIGHQDGKIPDSPPRGPALRGPRRRGVWGGSLLLPPPLFPGLLGPLEAAVGGLAGEGQTPGPDPGLGTPRPHTFPPPGGLLSPRLSLRGLCGDPRGSAATPCGPAPAPGPSGAFPCAKGNFREGGGLAPPLQPFPYHGSVGVIGGDTDEDPQALRSGIIGCAFADAGRLEVAAPASPSTPRASRCSRGLTARPPSR